MNAGTDVRDKVIVVAGGATGIGAAAARQLVGAGAKVVLGDINEEGGRATAAAIGGESGDISKTSTERSGKCPVAARTSC